jgi:hypothetical protein
LFLDADVGNIHVLARKVRRYTCSWQAKARRFTCSGKENEKLRVFWQGNLGSAPFLVSETMEVHMSCKESENMYLFLKVHLF